MADLVTFGNTALQLSPPGHERLATAEAVGMHADGIESGAAVAATALGGASTWVSKLPESPLGRQVVGQLRRRGVETDIVWADPDRARQGLVFRERPRPPREETIRHDQRETAVAGVSPDDLPVAVIQEAETVFSGVSTAALSEDAATTVQSLFQAAQGSGTTTALALDYRPGLRSADLFGELLGKLVENIDVLVAMEDHVETVCEMSGRPRELAHSLSAQYDLETVVVTRGDRSAVALEDTPGTNVVHEQEAMEMETVDTAGQQAAFVGGFLQHHGAGGDLPSALSYGVAAATLACTVPGPLLTATTEEIERVVGETTGTTR